MRRDGFTLVELLVVIAIIAILSSLLFAGAANAIQRTNQVTEISAGKDLMRGFFLYAQDHDDRVLPGYKNDQAYDEQGNQLHNPLNARYPWRLAPYMDYKVEGAFLAGPQRKARSRFKNDYDAFVYHTSLMPSLGMNVGYVGGDYTGVATRGAMPIPPHFKKFGAFCVTRTHEVTQPQNLMVFASGRYVHEGKYVAGYFKVTPPNVNATWEKDADEASTFGNLDLRYGGKAVAAFFDGHVDTMEESEALDMRHWSNQAGEENDPTFRPF